MYLSVENHEVIFGDDSAVQHSFQLDAPDVIEFLERFFKLLFKVATNRQCHRCDRTCSHALTLHFGRPFSPDFHSCVPS